MSQQDWLARTREAQTRLEALHFLVGSWRGEGHSYGAPITAALEVQLQLSGTFLQARERMWDASGTLEHEDFSVYRFASEEGHLRVRQRIAPAMVSERLVLVLPEGGIRWYEGPLGVQVYFQLQPDGSLQERVLMPEDAEPVITILYQRHDR